MTKKLWSGRFSAETDARVEHFTESISFDSRLFEQDIRGSMARARMLAHVGLITNDGYLRDDSESRPRSTRPISITWAIG